MSHLSAEQTALYLLLKTERNPQKIPEQEYPGLKKRSMNLILILFQ